MYFIYINVLITQLQQRLYKQKLDYPADTGNGERRISKMLDNRENPEK